MKHNPSLIASRLSSLRYSLRLMHREKAVPSYVTLLLPSTLFTRPLCSIAISVFLFVDIIILLWLLLFLFRSSDDQQQSLKKSCLYNKRCGSVSSLICSSRRHPTPPNSRRPNNHRKRRKGENEKTRLDLIHIITAREYINISMELAHYIAQHKSWFLYNRRQSSPISAPTIIIKRRQFFKLLASCACLATSFDEDKPHEQ